MTFLDFLVQRKGIDPTAETCLHALREIMHIAVSSVERGTLWRFVFEKGSSLDPEVCNRIERIAVRAGRYVNANRDHFTWRHGSQTLRMPETAGCIVDIWIREGEGRDPIALEHFKGQGVPGLVDLRRGTLYRLDLLETDPGKARELAEDIAVSRSRQHGLLMNPHIHTAEILAVQQGSAGAEAL